MSSVHAPELPPASAVVVATDRQVGCEVGGEAVVLHLDQGVYYGLNPVGARVWQLVQKPCAIDSIVERVTAEFDVEPEQCLLDVRELVVALRERSLVTVSEAAAP